MNNNNLIFIAFISFIGMMFITNIIMVFLVYKIVTHNLKITSVNSVNSIPLNQSFSPIHNSTLFNKSIEYIKSILNSSLNDTRYGEKNYYANDVLDCIYKLNEESKRKIITILEYYQIEPSLARENEELFMLKSQREGTPLWYTILKDACSKIMPGFFVLPDTNNNTPVIHINKVS